MSRPSWSFAAALAPDTTYLFKHALVRDAAYESLLKTRRQALHGRLFDILRQRGDVPPEILAQHAEAAGLTATAIDCWERAGEEAIARPAYKEAIAHLEAAIRLCRQLSADPEWLRRECQLQIRLGQALLENLGYQAPATMAAFERARELAERWANLRCWCPRCTAYGRTATFRGCRRPSWRPVLPS